MRPKGKKGRFVKKRSYENKKDWFTVFYHCSCNAGHILVAVLFQIPRPNFPVPNNSRMGKFNSRSYFYLSCYGIPAFHRPSGKGQRFHPYHNISHRWYFCDCTSSALPRLAAVISSCYLPQPKLAGHNYGFFRFYLYGSNCPAWWRKSHRKIRRSLYKLFGICTTIEFF